MIVIGDVISIDKNAGMITTKDGNIRANSPNNVLMAFKSDDQLSIYLKHNEFSQEHELIKDIKIGNTHFKKVSYLLILIQLLKCISKVC